MAAWIPEGRRPGLSQSYASPAKLSVGDAGDWRVESRAVLRRLTAALIAAIKREGVAGAAER